MQLCTNKGVTLIESLVAISLVGIALVTMLATFTIGKTISAQLIPRMKAINRLRETMERIKAEASFGGIASASYANWIIDDKGTANTADDIVSTNFYSNVITENNCRRVEVVIQWNESRGGTTINLQESLETYIANHWW